MDISRIQPQPQYIIEATPSIKTGFFESLYTVSCEQYGMTSEAYKREIDDEASPGLWVIEKLGYTSESNSLAKVGYALIEKIAFIAASILSIVIGPFIVAYINDLGISNICMYFEGLSHISEKIEIVALKIFQFSHDEYKYLLDQALQSSVNEQLVLEILKNLELTDEEACRYIHKPLRSGEAYNYRPVNHFWNMFSLFGDRLPAHYLYFRLRSMIFNFHPHMLTNIRTILDLRPELVDAFMTEIAPEPNDDDEGDLSPVFENNYNNRGYRQNYFFSEALTYARGEVLGLLLESALKRNENYDFGFLLDALNNPGLNGNRREASRNAVISALQHCQEVMQENVQASYNVIDPAMGEFCNMPHVLNEMIAQYLATPGIVWSGESRSFESIIQELQPPPLAVEN